MGWYEGAWREADERERWEKMDGSPDLGTGEAEALGKIEILVDPEISTYDTNVRRHYFRLRGKTVTRERTSDSYLRKMMAALGLEEDKVLTPQGIWGYKPESHQKEEDGWLLGQSVSDLLCQ